MADDYVLTGKIESTQGYDLYVVKTVADGSLIWEKTIPGKGAGSGYAVTPVRGGGLVVAGKKGLEGSTKSDILMLKLSGESVDNRGYMLSVGLALVIFVLMLVAFRLTQGKRERQ
ncbi:MAG: hypothetical protein RQM92_11415 [Candidatus Syntrophopropionicum ammoniitolerans]